ncbi:hypothetical protein Bca52824_076056 [Brassica carinata]|uniref:Neprosin PEP catalytic domain-containing protein n=1 Tax=Brassica carinata TaxID=52824 RepID=A0A8X7PTA5_BRACI|nr:hypothetical protein Bca52824_076056 [Brassica carinata]
MCIDYRKLNATTRKDISDHKCRRFDRCKTMRQTEAKLFSEETRMRTRERRRGRRRRIRGSFFSDVILLFRPCFSNILFLYLLLLSSSSSSVLSSETEHLSLRNQTLRPLEELNKLKAIKQHLRKINKPSVKTIYSSDGDIIDCVLLHHQPAFDHPRLRGHKPLDPPERPRGHNKRRGLRPKSFQLWRMEGGACPEGTVPIRRTKEEDILRANSVSSFGKKLKHFKRDTSSNGHEHAVGYVSGEKYYGAKASINVWAPQVQNQYEFSLSQIWIISGSFGNDLNTIEAGWQVSPELYGDNYPRFFTYWTNDAYQATGCYNLLCSGFVQTNSQVAIGAAISPSSSFKGGQFDITLLIWKDPKHGNWWLEFGSGILVGYWPSFLFTHLKEHASMVQYGGEVVNSSPFGTHTSTQMGSGHFAEEGFTKSSYFRNIQVVDWDNNLVSSPNLQVLANHPNCYDIQGGSNKAWGSYFYYGGPGKNPKCS